MAIFAFYERVRYARPTEGVTWLLVLVGILIYSLAHVLDQRDWYDALARMQESRAEGWDVSEQIRDHWRAKPW